MSKTKKKKKKSSWVLIGSPAGFCPCRTRQKHLNMKNIYSNRKDNATPFPYTRSGKGLWCFGRYTPCRMLPSNRSFRTLTIPG